MKRLKLLFFLGLFIAPQINAQLMTILGPEVDTIPCNQPCKFVSANFIKPKITTSYQSGSIAFNPVSITNPTSLSLLDDKFSSLLPIGFPFCFYGNVYSDLAVSANGHITFNPSYANGNCSFDTKQGMPFYNATYPDNSIFCPFSDGNTTVGGTIAYKMTGSAPYRKFVIQYSNIPFFGTGTACTGAPATFQCVLHETTNEIDLFISNKSTCNSDTSNWLNYSTLGVQSIGAANFHIVNGRNASLWTASSEGWKISPAGPPAYTMQWYQNGIPMATNVDSVNVCDPLPKTITAKFTLLCPNKEIWDTVQIVKPLPSIDSFSVFKTNCKNTATGSATVYASGGVPPYTYSINSGPFGGSNQFNNLSFGQHIIQVMDATGCISSILINVEAISTLQANIIQAKDPACPLNNGFLLGGATGGTPPYSYFWAPNNVVTQNIYNLGPGYYTLEVTDALGCKAQVGYYLKWDSLPIITAQVSKAVCGDSTGAIDVSIQGNSPFNYSWNIGGNSQDLNNIPAGNYTIYVTDVNGCSDSLPIVLQDTLNMQLFVNGFAHTTCGFNNGMGSATAMNGLPPYTYLWSNNDNNMVTNTLASGWQYITVTDNNGCVRTDSLLINASVPIQTTFLHTNAYCDEDNGVITAIVSGNTGAYTYAWNTGDTTATIDSLAAGTYTLIVTDSVGCVDTSMFTLINEGKPRLVVVDYQKPKCFGDSTGRLLLGGTSGVAPYKYSFDGINFTTVALATNFAAGSYTIYIRDANSCVSDTTIFFDPPEEIQITTGPIDTLVCYWDKSNAIQFTAQDGTPPYQWSTNGITYQSQNNLAGISIGNNTVYIKDSNGCIKEYDVIIPGPAAPLEIIYESENVPCYYSQGGEMDAQINGGWYPYMYTWGHTNSQNLFQSNLTAGTYTLSVEDGKGCTIDSIITIPQNYCCDCYFPNAFTPNGDTKNDNFKAITPARDIIQYELQVYNRWGERVFSTRQVEGFWNGMYKGEPAPLGTYFYQCKLKCQNKQDDVYLKGDILLIR